MVKKVTLDSSVIITSILNFEKRHKEAFLIFENIITGNLKVYLPYSVLVQVTGAVKRRTSSEVRSTKIREKLLGISNITFVELTRDRAEQASKIASELNLRVWMPSWFKYQRNLKLN